MKTKKSTNFDNCNFIGVQYDKKATRAIETIAQGFLENAKGLGRLANILNAQNVNIDCLLKVDAYSIKDASEVAETTSSEAEKIKEDAKEYLLSKKAFLLCKDPAYSEWWYGDDLGSAYVEKELRKYLGVESLLELDDIKGSNLPDKLKLIDKFTKHVRNFESYKKSS